MKLQKMVNVLLHCILPLLSTLPQHCLAFYKWFPKTCIFLLAVFLLHEAPAQRMQIYPVPLGDLKDFPGSVNCIFQDHIGFIWIGKESGLYRYDGKELRVYHSNPSDSLSISNNNVKCIAADAMGNLLVGTYGGGLNYFNRNTEKFTRYLHSASDTNSISYNQVFTICPDGKGSFWIGTDGGGLNFFTPSTGKFKHFKVTPQRTNGLVSDKILHISPASNGKYWLATWSGGLHLFDPNEWQCKHYGEGTRFNFCNMYNVTEVTPGVLWIATDDVGLIAFDIKSRTFSTIAPRSQAPYTWDMKVTAKGEIFVAASNGLLYFESAKSPFRIVDKIATNFVSTTHVFIDATQKVWVGAAAGIVGKINSNRKKFNTFPSTTPFSGEPVYGLFKDDKLGKLYFTIKNFLVVYDFSNQRIKSYVSPVEFLNAIFRVPQTVYLVCSSEKGLYMFNTETGKFTPAKFIDKSLQEILKSNIRSFRCTGPHSFWIGENAIAYNVGIDPRSLRWQTIKTIHTGGEDGFSESHFPSSFLHSPNGDFWIGTWGGGISRLRTGETTFAHFLQDAGNKNSISDNFVGCMAAGKNGDIFIGTQSGINIFNSQTSTFSKVQVAEGLADDWVLAVAPDSKNNAWVSTRRGISKISADFKTIRNYDFTDGLPANEFTVNAVTTDSFGNLYFGSKHGVVWFHPDSIIDNPLLSKAEVVNFRINNKRVFVSDNSPLKQCIELTNEIVLDRKQSSFSFQLAALGYFNPQRNKILYKLNGYDKTWQEPGPDGIAAYSEVPWGRYVFEVKVSNHDGIWNPVHRKINVEIIRPPWLSGWAIAFYLLVIAGLGVYVSVRVRKQLNLEPPVEIYTDVQKRSGYEFIQPSNIDIEPADQKFLQKVHSIVEENIGEPDFGVYQLADKMNLSRPHLYRKLSAITGLSIAEFIKVVRLKRGAQLLLQKAGTVSDVADKVGFTDPKYFGKCFKQFFGVSPAQYVSDNETDNSVK